MRGMWQGLYNSIQIATSLLFSQRPSSVSMYRLRKVFFSECQPQNPHQKYSSRAATPWRKAPVAELNRPPRPPSAWPRPRDWPIGLCRRRCCRHGRCTGQSWQLCQFERLLSRGPERVDSPWACHSEAGSWSPRSAWAGLLMQQHSDDFNTY